MALMMQDRINDQEQVKRVILCDAFLAYGNV